MDGSVKVVKTKIALTWRWNARKAYSGPHTISVKAFDAAGNVGEQSITVYKKTGIKNNKGSKLTAPLIY